MQSYRLNIQSGYWHSGSEPEIGYKDILSTNTNADATFGAGSYIFKVDISSNVHEYGLAIGLLRIIAAVRCFGEG